MYVNLSATSSCCCSDSMAKAWDGGHSAPVLCVQSAGGAEGLVASGAERGEVTVWSQDGTPIAQLRLPGEEDVTCTVFSPAGPGHLYASHGEAVSVLDPRCLKEPVERLSNVGEEEINTLSFNDTGTMLAAGDDAGAVRIVEVQSGKVVRTLRRHTNICSSVAFRPQRPQSLVSAGLDMQVLLWNLQKARPVWAVNLQEEAECVESEGRSQLFNPALAHCVGVSSCGDVMACAAEDGRLHLMRVGAGSRLVHRGAIKAHSQGASQAHFLPFLSHPYWLVSGGNDGVVALWDLSAHGLPPQDRSAHSSRRRARGRGRGKARAKPPQDTAPPAAVEGEAQDSGAVAGEEGCEGSCDSVCEGVCEPAEAVKTGPVLKFTHTQKLNWVCPALLQGRPSILVADQSTCVSVYPLPAL